MLLMGQQRRRSQWQRAVARTVLIACGVSVAFLRTVGTFLNACGSQRPSANPSVRRQTTTSEPTAQQSRREWVSRVAGLIASPLGLCCSDEAGALTVEENRVTALFSESAPSVLGLIPAMMRGAKSLGTNKPARPMASAFVWDDAHVLTSFQILQSVHRPRLAFLGKGNVAGDHEYLPLRAEVVGGDPATDVAVLRIIGERPADMRPLRHGSSSSLQVGQLVYAIGNPYGLEQSMSRGVVSGVARSLDGGAGSRLNGLIQTDACMSAGYGGGPLLDSSGAVVGVNMPINGRASGVTLAMPIDTVRRNVDCLIEKGYISHPWIGATFAPDIMGAELGLAGAMIKTVEPKGPAEAAGLMPMRGGRLGDIVTEIGGVPISSSGDVISAIEGRDPGETVLISVRRPVPDSVEDDYDLMQVTLQLGSLNWRMAGS